MLARLACLLPLLLASAAEAAPRIEVYTREGCPHCLEAKAFLADLAARRSGLEVREHDVGRDREAAAELGRLCERAGVRPCGVPTFVVAGEIVCSPPYGQRRRDERVARETGPAEGTFMRVSAQISLYPLRQEKLGPASRLCSRRSKEPRFRSRWER